MSESLYAVLELSEDTETLRLVAQEDGEVLATIPSTLIVLNRLFDEDREGFTYETYEEDSRRVTEILSSLLSTRNLFVPVEFGEDKLLRAVRRTCEPDGFHDPADFVVRLERFETP